ncbi:MAG: F0F1 ATP synthase subunit delta [Chthoniobacterales bacterium]|nr:F0F1 ATP synthase subunit delta [Chthoniobacterales bacterium]
MKISKEAQYLSRQLFDAAFVNGCLDEARSLKIAEAIEQTRPRYAFQILKEFTRLLRLELAKHHALVESATPLDEASKQAIMFTLKQGDPQVTFSVTTNTSLIGGARIQLGSNVWDGSVAARLEKLKTTVLV